MTVRCTRPARSRMRMCFEVELSEIGKSLASSVTRASAVESRAMIARRVGSETAAKTSSSCVYSPIWVNIGPAKIEVKSNDGRLLARLEIPDDFAIHHLHAGLDDALSCLNRPPADPSLAQ